jgi:hypothetical protein
VWISSAIARDASVNDTMLFKQIFEYLTFNKTVADAAKKKLKNHLWCLGSKLIPLCLFSDKIPVEEKRCIAAANLQCGDDWNLWELNLQHAREFGSKYLHNPVGASSCSALRLLV